MKPLNQSLALLALFILSACNSDKEDIDLGGGPMQELICTEEFVSGLHINVFDQETGLNSACGVTVSIQDGDYTEVLTNDSEGTCSENFIFLAAGEKAGTYDISIIKDDYLEWTQYDTEVTNNICHVNPVTVNAYMEKIEMSDDVIDCAQVVSPPALSIAVFEKLSGLPNACGVTITIKDGDFSEELSNDTTSDCNESFIFSAITQREGSYDISIIKDGYVDWHSYDNEITSNACFLNPISIEAYLVQ